MFDRKTYFDIVRGNPFGGSMSQSQVDGQEAILDAWERAPFSDDLRFLSYPLATTFHETAATMQPIEEYGKGAGHEYGLPDCETGQTYYGRGYVQLTWRDNYARADSKIGLSEDAGMEWHAERALDPDLASQVMFRGMTEGWFTGKKLYDYFTASLDDPVNARAIINADVSKNGKLVAGYHEAFLDALVAAAAVAPQPEPEPEPEPVQEVVVTIRIGVSVSGANVRVVVEEEAS